MLTSLQAQTLSNQGQVIHVTGKAIISIDGSLQNNGFFINNGSILISGDWENPGSYNAGEGEVVLTGTTTQIIKHNAQSFYTLHLKGKGEKQFSEDASVTHELILSQGLLTPASGRTFVISSEGQIIGGSQSSYINGRLCHQGTGDKFFPIGKNDRYAPVTLTDIVGFQPLTGIDYFEPNPQAKPGGNLLSVSQEQYWQKTQISGSLTSAFITLPVATSHDAPAGRHWVIAEADQPVGPYRNLGRNPNSSNSTSIHSLSPITGSIFTIGMAAKEPIEALYIPNVFSPLATSDEDRTLKIYGSFLNTEGFVFRIYNRWGNLIFESRSLEEMSQRGWDGTNTYTGKPEANSIYTYTLTAKQINGNPFKKTGTITLIQ